MRTLNKAKVVRNDFMQGHGKGHAKDMLTRQAPSARRKLTDDDISNLYANNRIVQNIIDIPAEDMTRGWFTLKMKDENLKNEIMRKMRDLNARGAFKKMRSFERLRGDGFISLGVTQSAAFQLNDPIDLSKLKSVDYLHAFSSKKVSEFVMNEDMFSKEYGQVEFFKIKRKLANGSSSPDDGKIHASRLIHDQTRRLEDDTRGQSLLEPLYDTITVLDTSLWSVGQMLYDYAFKIYKSDGIDDMKQEERTELGMIMDYMFRTEAVAIIGINEDLKKEATNTTGIKDLLDYVWDMLAGGARMPKTVIKGQEAGTIAGAQYDVMNYYSRIAAQQENEMRPYLERLIGMLLWSSDELGGQMDPENVDYEISFNPLWEVDAETDAKIRKLTAEADEIYIEMGVATPEEVREKRYGQFGFNDLLKYSGDESEWNKIAEEVYQANQKNGGQNG